MSKDTLINFVLPALNLLGVFLIVVGVFVFANVAANRGFSFGAIRLPNDPASGLALIAFGFVLFGAATVSSRILKKK